MSPESISTVPRDDVRELRMLFELSQLLDSTAHIEDTLDGALKLMARYMQMMRGMITLVSQYSGQIRIETAYGLNPVEKARGYYAPGEGIVGTVIQTGKPMVVSNVSKEPMFLNRTRSRNMKKDGTSFLCVPIRVDHQVIGALAVDRLFGDTKTLEEDARLLTIMASMLARAAKVRQGCMEERRSRARPDATLQRPPGFVSASASMQMVYAQIAQVASSNTTVLVRGESGTGKELVAQAIHACGARASLPFVSLNCAALPESLIESELFGHEKGAFTGATGVRRGRFEMAHGGTLLLDEVGEMSLLTQAKFLRVLQERTFERLGGMETRQVDVRIITATNRHLEEMVEQGSFRHDLYYRLNVFPITLPPLRQRRGDILLLANHFMEKYAAVNGRTGVRLSLSVADMLHRYQWPGNIRELENLMERAVLLAGEEGLILPQHLPLELHSELAQRRGAGGGGKNFDNEGSDSDEGRAGGTLQERLDELEHSCILEALRTQNGHVGRAAAALGLTERIMALRMKKYSLNYKKFRGTERRV